jgi:hypothetical protein
MCTIRIRCSEMSAQIAGSLYLVFSPLVLSLKLSNDFRLNFRSFIGLHT